MNVRLLPHTPDHLRALHRGPGVYESEFGLAVAAGVAEFLGGPKVSEHFQARVETASAADPWRDGFGVLHLAENLLVGLASFNGPPDADGAVEISYGIAPGYAGRGYATAAVQLLIAYAADGGEVRRVRARTMPQENASTRVLRKCGFNLQGEVLDPEDGLIWQWERPLDL